MRLSRSAFAHTRKEAPADETAKNAQLLIRAGYIHKEMAGVYALLPLGLRVVEKIKQIVREEMNAIGSEELLMTTMQRKELWEQTDRWDDEKVDVWFKSKLKNQTEVGFGWSHEEPITDMMREFIASYRDLPCYVYQFQNKLRNETRAKSGMLRGREFIMKDLYSYSQSEEEHKKFYDKVTDSYLKVFDRVGLGDVTFLTFASGGAFTQFSHEFQTLTAAGEDTIYLHREKKLAINEEVLTDDVMKQLGVVREQLEEVKAAEVGNIFSFGSTKSEQLGLMFADESGKSKPVVLGSYGIGITRLMGVVVEHFADERGLIWPEAIAPYQIHLIAIGESNEVKQAADKAYEQLNRKNVDVLYDDREERPGVKLADADLIGIPKRVVISDKTAQQHSFELKQRSSPETKLKPLSELENISS